MMQTKNTFFSRYKTFLYYGLLALIGTALISIWFGKKQGHNSIDFVLTAQAFQKWDPLLDRDDQELENLNALLKTHPELTPRYEAQIGQNLLEISRSKRARPYVEHTLKRTAQPYYSSYAQTSLSVSDGHYTQALEEAIKLKEEMGSAETFWEKAEKTQGYGSALFALNLMRIAVLYGELGDQREELNAWKALKCYGGIEEGARPSKKIEKEGFARLLAHFTVQERSLLDYIKARENQLTAH